MITATRIVKEDPRYLPISEDDRQNIIGSARRVAAGLSPSMRAANNEFDFSGFDEYDPVGRFIAYIRILSDRIALANDIARYVVSATPILDSIVYLSHTVLDVRNDMQMREALYDRFDIKSGCIASAMWGFSSMIDTVPRDGILWIENRYGNGKPTLMLADYCDRILDGILVALDAHVLDKKYASMLPFYEGFSDDRYDITVTMMSIYQGLAILLAKIQLGLEEVKLFKNITSQMSDIHRPDPGLIMKYAK